jgi:hypothetical protein
MMIESTFTSILVLLKFIAEQEPTCKGKLKGRIRGFYLG